MKIKIGNVESEIKYMDRLLSTNNHSELIIRGQILIKKFSKIVPFYNLLGLSYKKIGKQDAAIKVFQSALFNEPNAISAMTNLADVYRDIDKLKEAEELLLKALKLNSKDIFALISYGKLKIAQGKTLEAIVYFKKVAEIDNSFDDVLIRVASSYLSINDFNNAKKYFEIAVYRNTTNPGAHYSYSQMIDYSNDKKHQEHMLKTLDDSSLDKNKLGPMYLALAKSFGDQKKYEKAHEFLKLGNDTINTIVYNKKLLEREKDNLEKIKLIFSDFNFDNISINKNIYEKNIIFVVGLPRSGTTLTHQIIASHSKVVGVGETKVLHAYFLPNIKKNNFKEKIFSNGKLNGDFISDLSITLSKNYEYFSKSKIIVDKAPFNFFWLGFIKILFPNVKIIHVNRNIKDTALSIYKNLFGSRKMDWTYSQENIVSYIKIYKEIMHFWKTKFPDFIYELSYEQLVNNQEEDSKKLIKFCGLEWEEECLNFHNSPPPIHTMSLYESRKPIYTSSVNLNEKYSKYLDFFEKLDKL